MAVLLFILIFLPLSVIVAYMVADRTARALVIRVVIQSWLLFMPLLSAINSWMPFVGGSDDEDYFILADPPIQSLADALDLSRFSSVIEQPGYPWLLSLTNTIFGHNLFVYKALNFFFLVSLSLIWYRIGFLLEGPKFARRIMLVVLLLTPLWNYVFFLLKDMSITLLQSLFLLVAIQIWTKPAIRPVLVGVISTITLLLFRTPLVLQNTAVLLGGLSAKAFGRTGSSLRIMPFFLGMLFISALLYLATNSEIMSKFGIFTEHRIIGSSEFIELGAQLGEGRSIMNRNFFPILYLFSETAGLSPKQWSKFDGYWLRGVLAIPWIFLIVPFFLVGSWKLFYPTNGVQRAYGLVARLRASRVISTPWSIVLLFVAVSIAISWTVGDTTRWRIPDMPMVAAIALAGWKLTHPRIRQQLFLGWIAASGLFFFLFYLLRG